MGGAGAAIIALLAATPALAQVQQPIDQSAAGASSLSSAQETAPPSIEEDGTETEIIVTGIRASLASSAAQKRDASGILDAISSEDLGKFPDANVAESLQRIPGVAIDRSNGEGRSVTVRGLGPAFNTVLFNGRSFASDNYSRAFSFDLIPAELISGAQVYKSTQAPLQGGGIGATINVQTPRPLDLKGFKGVFSAKALYEKNSDKFTPQVFGLLSDTFADGTIGVLASLSYQRRVASIDSITNDGYFLQRELGPGGSLYKAPDGDRGVYAPRTQAIGNSVDRRTRLGATLVAQYAPTDELTITVDGLYNKFKSDQEAHSLGSWFEPSSYTAYTVDSNRTITSLTTNGNADFVSSGAVRETTTYEFGGNIEWRPSDSVKVVLDASRSRAKNAAGGKGYFVVIGTPTTYSFQAPEGGGIPSTFGYTPGALTTPALGRTHIAGIGGDDVTEKVTEYRLNTEWKAETGALKTLRFGLMRTSRDKRNVPITSDPNIGCFYCGYLTSADPSLLSPFTVKSFGGGAVPTSFLQFDAQEYLKFLTSPAATLAIDAARGLPPGTIGSLYAQTNGYAATPQPSTRVKESVYAGYVDVDFAGDLGGVPWFVNIGARYEHTELRSYGQQQQLLDLVQNDPTIYTGVYANNGAAVSIDKSTSYDIFLPNLNARVNIAPKFQARFAAYKSLTRPALSDLAPSLTFTTLRPATLTAAGGNPDLKPYRATNFDLSFEYYPTRTTTLSAAVFYKHVNDFITQVFAPEVFTIANSQNISGQYVDGKSATFSVRRPRNGGSLDIRGLELNVVHSLDWAPGFLSGFGVQANATFVKSNRPFDVTVTDQSFAAEGIGNSQNATVFYEKYGISARIAYNRREKFLQTLAGGPGNEPVFVRNYGQFDGSAAYNVTDNAQVFIEGTNLFNAKYITTGRFDNQVLNYQNTGPRYDVGFRLNF
ncbi:TonB-dependent receptor [Sphingomonas sp. PB4P5]|uniref:TonB-dependent receptor n=1 Tax=Parasphingomonas puruogangriensis TaxID=3096155 RepID=UPI002FCBF8CC